MRNPDNPLPQEQKPALLATMRNTIERYKMFAPEDHVVVAVSGGADSVTLLHALCKLAPELNLRLTIAHLNHNLRGASLWATSPRRPWFRCAIVRRRFISGASSHRACSRVTESAPPETATTT